MYDEYQVHRPYWDYYFLHFAIPMAWLSGVVIQELWGWIFAQDAEALKRFPYKALWGILSWSSLLALLVPDCPFQFRNELVRIQNARRIEDSGLVKLWPGYQDRVEWIYTGQLVEAFHARLKVIPELAVIPTKRLKSGQIDGRKILEVIKKYKPGLIMPGSYGDEPGWQEYLEGHYERIPSSSQMRQAIYVRRDL